MNLYKRHQPVLKSGLQETGFSYRKRLEILLCYLEMAGEKAAKRAIELLFEHLSKKTRRKLLGKCNNKLKKKQAEQLINDDFFFSRLLNELWHNADSYAKINKLVFNTLRKLIDKSCTDEERNGADLLCERFNKLQSLFSLSDDEIECLVLLYMLEHDSDVSAVFYCDGYAGDVAKKTRRISQLTGFSLNSVCRFFANDGAIKRFGVVDSDLDVAEHISEFLCGINEQALQSQYFTEFKGSVIELTQHESIKNEKETIVQLVRNAHGKGSNILFYGPPGVGKTEFARALGRHLKRNVYEINNVLRDSDDSGVVKRFMALKTCRECIELDKSLIILDEADELLNGDAGLSLSDSRNTEKNMVNEALDERQGTVIWITNTHHFIDESTRRRFDYSVEFPKVNREQRLRIWQTALDKYGLGQQILTDDLKHLAYDYEVSAGGIDVAARNFARLYQEGNHQQKPVDIFKRLLNAHVRIMSGRQIRDTKAASERDYSITGLNISGELSLEKVVSILKRFSNSLQKTKKGDVPNMNLLLSGPPGTGKTEFAKHVARELNRPLMVKLGSDLLSMYIGETEKLIRKAFDDAEYEGAVLFIDEVDGLIGERSKASHSWEVTQVNELLARMETFRGVFVCATNFKENVDNAAIRRFNLKLKFDYLNDQGKHVFFQRLLQPLTGHSLSNQDEAALSRIVNLTPGDFKVVKQKYSFLVDDALTNQALIAALLDEVSHKTNKSMAKLGF